jgi:hypothetical protein
MIPSHFLDIMIKLGYSLGVPPDSKYSLKERIKIISSVETYAVELSYLRKSRLKDRLDKEDIEGLKKFQYRSIHAPAIDDDYDSHDKRRWIRYPNKESAELLDLIIEIADETKANTILFHPESIDDFNWLNEKVGERLAFENMDIKKSFGATIKDLEKVFSQAPKAKWVCDVNHIYTIDSSMKLADDFHQAFGDRLCHYHLSSYGGLHDSFYISQEDIILKGLKDFSKPIIHEGWALRDGKDSLVKENKYILNRLC